MTLFVIENPKGLDDVKSLVKGLDENGFPMSPAWRDNESVVFYNGKADASIAWYSSSDTVVISGRCHSSMGIRQEAVNCISVRENGIGEYEVNIYYKGGFANITLGGKE